MEIRIVNGQEATDLAGAAEYLGISPNSARQYAAPKRLPRTGWPPPLPDRQDGRTWYPLTALAAYWQEHNPAPPPMIGDPDELVDIAGFAAMRGIKRETMESYVHISRDAWKRGQDGYLPRPNPDDCIKGPTGRTIHRWRRGQAAAWVFPAQRRVSTGRPPADQTVTLADYDAVINTDSGPQLSEREIAAALTDRKGRTVSIQTVKRLRRRARERDSGTPNDAHPRHG